jgi:hypothetical protein
MKKIFLTGVYRSGTTLLDKVLNSHPQVSVFSQPFPPLYFHIKSEFYSHLRIERLFPINPDFMEESYSHGDLSDFLESHEISFSELDFIFEEIRNYKGHLTPGVHKYRSLIKEGEFINVFSDLIKVLYEKSEIEKEGYVGVKEILGEEFIPYFIQKEVKSIIIIRDPRDIICSANFGKGSEYTGSIRPLLYTMRLWRKSVAYAIAHKNDPEFLSIKYEDLILHTDEVLSRITSFLNIENYKREEVLKYLRDQNNNFWQGNSSFALYSDINAGSIGQYKTMLDKASIKFIENVCYPEMKCLGYGFENEDHDIESISEYEEPFQIDRKNFQQDFSSDKKNVADEIKRIFLLKQKKISEKEQSRVFLFPEAYSELKRQINGN